MSKRFGLGEEHSSVAHGISLHIVEVSVGIGLVVVVESVGTQCSYEHGVLRLRFGDISEIHSRGVALVFHVEAELGFLHRLCQVIHVLHHQSPVGHHRRITRVLQRFHKERLAGVGVVGGKLAHLVCHTAVGVFKCHGQHLVGLQRRFKTHVSQRRVYSIFRRREQSCALHLLIIHSSSESRNGVEHGVCLVDVACCHIVVGHGIILVVGAVARHHVALSSPNGIARMSSLSQVGESHDISGVGCGGCLVCHPYLHSCYLYARGEVGQC